MKKITDILITLIALQLFTACTADEPNNGAAPAPLSITANADGFTTRASGDIKTRFDAGDIITLTVGSKDYPATLMGDGTWQTDLTLPTEGSNITLTAEYKPDDAPDHLIASAGTADGTLTLGIGEDGKPQWNVTLHFTHTKAVVDMQVYDPKGTEITSQMQSVTLTIDNSESFSKSPEDILLTAGTLTDITVQVGGIDYVVTGLDHTLAAGTRYTIQFICDPVEARATITSNLVWGEGESVVLGYDYVITNLQDLKDYMTAMKSSSELKKKAIQMADIEWDDSIWTPIGKNGTAFTGVYNGNGYKISGLKLGRGGDNQTTGMFGFTQNALLMGIHLRGATTTDACHDLHSIGLLVGWTHSNTTISLCSAQGTITHRGTDIGGLVGQAAKWNGTTHITSCYADVKIECKLSTNNTYGYCGGLVGYNQSLIVACGANADIQISGEASLESCVGGLTGINIGDNIYFCYATGSVSNNATNSTLRTGGLSGRSNYRIYYSYSTTHATGSANSTGSFVGYNSSTITSCHATGTVNGIIGESVGVESSSASHITTTDDETTRRAAIQPDPAVTSTAIRTAQYNAETGYSCDPDQTYTFSSANVWQAEGELPDINYLYNGVPYN
ncbi:hypothetical protein LJC35_04910 [Parabacteroides sp. OttesenSCG-928-N08]|nr:hypothetical protein [Parabacteroides sp. OttesenSCG-928-N08]